MSPKRSQRPCRSIVGKAIAEVILEKIPPGLDEPDHSMVGPGLGEVLDGPALEDVFDGCGLGEVLAGLGLGELLDKPGLGDASLVLGMFSVSRAPAGPLLLL